MASPINDGFMVTLVAPNISEQISGEAIKSPQIFSKLTAQPLNIELDRACAYRGGARRSHRHRGDGTCVQPILVSTEDVIRFVEQYPKDGLTRFAVGSGGSLVI